MKRDEMRAYDVRVLERNLRRGLLSRKDYDKFLKGLPDRADNAAAARAEDKEGGSGTGSSPAGSGEGSATG